jgi:hypothetical protein
MPHLFARQSFWPGRFLKQNLPRSEAIDLGLTSGVQASLTGYRMAERRGTAIAQAEPELCLKIDDCVDGTRLTSGYRCH